MPIREREPRKRFCCNAISLVRFRIAFSLDFKVGPDAQRFKTHFHMKGCWTRPRFETEAEDNNVLFCLSFFRTLPVLLLAAVRISSL